jgi:predicted NAD-dependent protein-ADP-ribosyltransferase YbiA (DUF1768 family)
MKVVFLSNFYTCSIEHQGIKYPSGAFYVAMKSNDEQLIDGKYTTGFREFVAIESAGKVKRLGSKIKLRKTGMLRNLNL